VIRDLRNTSPLLELQIHSGDTSQVIELLQQNKVDLALGLVPSNPVGLALRPIFRDEMLFTFSPAHPWADGRALTREEIQKQQFISYTRNSLTALLLEEYFRRLQIVPNAAIEVGSTTAILKLVQLNLGLAVLAPWTADQELSDGSLNMRPLGPKPLHRRWAVISLASRRMTLAEETFCRLCRSAATGMRLDRDDLPALEQREKRVMALAGG